MHLPTSRKAYTMLQWMALILLPALAVLVQGLAELYAWPEPCARRLIGTLNLVGVFLGALLQG
ncbi:phage holin [Abiotrophia sp.]|nr:phage holin [Abiotrophia sp.]